jgi:hypothetical protein
MVREFHGFLTPASAVRPPRDLLAPILHMFEDVSACAEMYAGEKLEPGPSKRKET